MPTSMPARVLGGGHGGRHSLEAGVLLFGDGGEKGGVQGESGQRDMGGQLHAVFHEVVVEAVIHNSSCLLRAYYVPTTGQSVFNLADNLSFKWNILIVEFPCCRWRNRSPG